jgi:hypothetical protein
MADPQRRYRKMAPATDRELILKIDEALAAEGKGRKLWYWPASPRGRLKASAVIDETRGYVRPVALTALADELAAIASMERTPLRRSRLRSNLCPATWGQTLERSWRPCAKQKANGLV